MNFSFKVLEVNEANGTILVEYSVKGAGEPICLNISACDNTGRSVHKANLREHVESAFPADQFALRLNPPDLSDLKGQTGVATKQSGPEAETKSSPQFDRVRTM